LRKINLKINANSPEFFAISGKESVTKTIEEISERIKNEPFENYSIGRYFNKKNTMIFSRKNNPTKLYKTFW